MCPWTPWRRRAREATDDRLDAAAVRSQRIAVASADARVAVDAAIEREQRQRRLNHLGQLAHDALMTPGWRRRP